LSYRAQLAGWECLYLPAVDVPAELPPRIVAFKRQQSRWAQGTTQCLRKLGGRILQKAMGLIHLSGYVAHALMVLQLIASLPLLLVPASAQLPLGGLGLMCLGPPLLYAVSERRLHADWHHRLRSFPLLTLLGVGIAWCDTKAVWRGLTRWGGTFARTPKFQLERRSGRRIGSRYRLRASDSIVGELSLALYALVTAAAALMTSHYGVLPFTLLYAAGFGTVAGMELVQALADRQGHPLLSRLSPEVPRRRKRGSVRPVPTPSTLSGEARLPPRERRPSRKASRFN